MTRCKTWTAIIAYRDYRINEITKIPQSQEFQTPNKKNHKINQNRYASRTHIYMTVCDTL